MLVSLRIDNVVLIDHIFIEFQTGFCALTGETGAGKSILLDALGLALGARSETGLVRKGADQAQVTAEFHIKKEHPSFRVLHEADLDADTTLLLRRVVTKDGRSRAFINDQAVSVGLLKKLGETLVEIHGQFETQGLLDAGTHRAILDDYAGLDAGLRDTWDKWRAADRDLTDSREKMEKARTDQDYLRTAVEDIDALEPQEGEEDKLVALRERLMRRGQIMENLTVADDSLGAAETAMNAAFRALEKVGDDGAAMRAGLDRVSAEMQEVTAGIQILSVNLTESEYSLEEIDDRLHALRGQARKHDCSVDELLSVRDELARQLTMIEQQDHVLADLVKKVEQARVQYIDRAEKESETRRTAAEKLDKLVAKELPPLKLEKAQFVTQIERLEEREWRPQGIDRVRFLVSTNPGREPGPLNKIASGGEMARFMLALKVVMAEVGAAGSLVFDEVDSGIGGSTAAAVGERLARLALSRQILVVTHAPQVAARAGHHWIVLKDGKTDVKTNIIPLHEVDARREEIARMLSGAEVTTEARAAADKLLETGTGM